MNIIRSELGIDSSHLRFKKSHFSYRINYFTKKKKQSKAIMKRKPTKKIWRSKKEPNISSDTHEERKIVVKVFECDSQRSVFIKSVENSLQFSLSCSKQLFKELKKLSSKNYLRFIIESIYLKVELPWRIAFPPWF